MNTKLLLEYTMFAEVIAAVTCLFLMARRGILREFVAVALFLSVLAVNTVISIAAMFFRAELGIGRVAAYQTVFYSRWVCVFAEDALVLLVIYGVFQMAIRPLKGLHSAGKIIFRWVAAVGIILSVCLALGPHSGSTSFFGALAERIQQGASVLMICLLLFVCFSIRPLGLTLKSRIFGVALGLGVLSASSLVIGAWISSEGAHSIYSPVFLASGLCCIAGLSVWGTYFAMPEPERKMIMLPTTSPYFFWNKLSEALGDHPGNVVVAGFRPEMLAKAELDNLKASSRRARERQADTDAGADQVAATQLQTVSATR